MKKDETVTTLMTENVKCIEGVGCEQLVELNAVCDDGDLYS